MTQDIKTLELAKIYESQGYYKEAHEIYLFLHELGPSTEVKAGLTRLEKRVAPEKQEVPHGKNIAVLFEKWLMLMVLKQRMDNLKKMKSWRSS